MGHYLKIKDERAAGEAAANASFIHHLLNINQRKFGISGSAADKEG